MIQIRLDEPFDLCVNGSEFRVKLEQSIVMLQDFLWGVFDFSRNNFGNDRFEHADLKVAHEAQ